MKLGASFDHSNFRLAFANCESKEIIAAVNDARIDERRGFGWHGRKYVKRAGDVNELEQGQLRFLLFGAGETDAQADQADGFSGAGESFLKQQAKLIERR